VALAKGTDQASQQALPGKPPFTAAPPPKPTARVSTFQAASIVASLARAGAVPRAPLLNVVLAAGPSQGLTRQLMADLMEGLTKLMDHADYPEQLPSTSGELSSASAPAMGGSGLSVDSSDADIDAYVDAAKEGVRKRAEQRQLTDGEEGSGGRSLDFDFSLDDDEEESLLM
jgi:hypothetical protein